MKKIIAAAVTAAFVAPAFAADVNISGDFITDYRDSDGTSSVNNDHDANITATTETANGLTVTGTIGISGTAGQDASNISVAGPFGKVVVGDTGSVTDRIDGITDMSYFLGEGSGSASDANLAYTLPTMVEGLTVVVSHSADSGSGGAHNGQEGTGYGLDYSFGMGSIHYAEVTNEDDSAESSVGFQASFSGVGVAYIASEQEDSSAAVTEDTSMMVSYTMSDLMVFVEQFEDEDSSDAVIADKTIMGAQYSIGGGVTLFAEMAEDDQDATADETSVGIAFKF